MSDDRHDIEILRRMVEQYVELASDPIQEERRNLWQAHYSLKRVRPPIICRFGMWNNWCRLLWQDANMQCRDPFFRSMEQALNVLLFHGYAGDDYILEPWINMQAVHRISWGQAWGVDRDVVHPEQLDGAYKPMPFIHEWADAKKLVAPKHEIDEEATARNLDRLHGAIGDLIEINVDRRPILAGPGGDLSGTLGLLRGIDQMMRDMYDSPEELHNLVRFMRDGVLANQQQAEDAGDYTMTSGENQAMCYADELERPKANSGPRKRSQLWGFGAAQEFTLVSPKMTEEFIFQYQRTILQNYALVSYGCCEDLTRKIDMVRQLKNVRCIAVSPVANLRKCAEQIGTDYCMSWRPNPADMVATDWNEERVRTIISEGLEITREQYVHISLKDVETVGGELERYPRWVKIVRELAEKA
ncbi:MAG: hypothetical protein GXX94_00050 [Chloroflexi bacterium]|nr:hypothetical protein [Chloroflexota bacterium]